jgi:hypothetical protein
LPPCHKALAGPHHNQNGGPRYLSSLGGPHPANFTLRHKSPLVSLFFCNAGRDGMCFCGNHVTKTICDGRRIPPPWGTALKKLLNFGSVRNEFRYHPIFYLRAAYFFGGRHGHSKKHSWDLSALRRRTGI